MKLVKKLSVGIVVSFIVLTQLSTVIIQPVSTVSLTDHGLQGMVTISNKADGQALFTNSTDSGNNITCGDMIASEKFQWQLVHYGKYTDDYMIINNYNMLLIGIGGNSSAVDEFAINEPLTKDPKTDWMIIDELLFEFEAVGSYFAIKSVVSGLYLTQTAENFVVQQNFTGVDLQLWDLQPFEIDIPEHNNLIWADEFNYEGLPDENFWSFEQIVINNEDQFYLNSSDNCYVENGCLRITAIKEEFGYKDYTSARINTRDKFNFTYGKIEARIKVPGGNGTWPAFWMMPQSFDPHANPWPDCGEIDIMEYVGYDLDKIHAHNHNELYSGLTVNEHGSSVEVSNVSTEWHTYGLIWSEERLIYYVDDWVYYIYENVGLGKLQYPYTEPFYIILNLAIGGNWGGTYGIDPSIFPVSYYVDWIRVYEEGSASEEDRSIPGFPLGVMFALSTVIMFQISYASKKNRSVWYEK